ADQRLQRLRAAAEIVDGDVEALLLEVAEALADGQRQIVKRGLAADGERDLLLLNGLGVRGGAERKRERERSNCGLGYFHFCPPGGPGEPHSPSYKMIPTPPEAAPSPPLVRVGPAAGRHTSSRRSASVTRKSIPITKAASTTMPANTPATSNTPSACWMREPSPAAEPRYSPTTAPTTAKPTEVWSEENIQDSAEGQYTWRMSERSLIPNMRAFASTVGLTSLTP